MTALFFLHMHNVRSQPPSDLYFDTISLVRAGKDIKASISGFF